MRRVLLLALFASFLVSFMAKTNPKQAWKAYWAEKNVEFATKGESPLTEEDRLIFKRLKTFPYNSEMRITAGYTVIDTSSAFKMKTSTTRTPVYQTVGRLDFKVNGVKEELFVYRNIELSKKQEYANYLFIPFTDQTNFHESYGGGRYIDVEGPIGTELVIEFNNAYNPYCAYSDRYSCPIPPIENHLETRITAGVLVFRKDKDH